MWRHIRLKPITAQFINNIQHLPRQRNGLNKEHNTLFFLSFKTFGLFKLIIHQVYIFKLMKVNMY